MASEIIVNTIKAPTTGANANKVIIPTGVTLDIADNLAYDSMPANTIIQQVEYFSDSTFNTTSTSFVATNASVNITPRYANSKMLIQVFGGCHVNTQSGMRGVIRKNGTTSFAHSNNEDLINYASGSGQHAAGHPVAVATIDNNVGTTNQVTYAYYVHAESGAAYFYRNYGIVVQEIKV